MYKINVHALSVNRCWQGRRFKTKDYENYEKELSFLLPRELKVPKKEKLQLTILFGLSNKMNDIDNGLKPFIDVLQKNYDFNDKMIYRLLVQKEDTKKGEEFISFNIKNI